MTELKSGELTAIQGSTLLKNGPWYSSPMPLCAPENFTAFTSISVCDMLCLLLIKFYPWKKATAVASLRKNLRKLPYDNEITAMDNA